ncbi:alpha/beta fold hydrolase [Streptomyces acidiscabies]|uniref:Alpha/beta hydrolase n=1 Tax=Streptomyces acidiscabies TaxID=42234 RepID=A0AAP6BCH4_9ACTN|nr:alpha/beta hydrolase [Streptomyces acidiscabies]MBP5938505.1 alpha/beta hydrolase [Streptomyces sp. LBUM 1476]MBZ3909612.1 alpha/beta hydrolase [Streptomyces acidiscabies]MDX2962219.1 alpha/beta hydrolase [Streptomyces acidiscabies]MDX3019671.1 alpha/beta hydrolase [Streptomyces acidiscabies]MDX3792238.1 alpha/beta hydrolase [Streptomyces acidiscabies]
MQQLHDALGHLAYDVTGDGPPVVLVHAGVADHRMWDAVVPALAERYAVVRYDLRGFGESAPPTGSFREVDDLARLLDHLGYGRVRLVGASWGGRVALDFTLAYPDRVQELAMLTAPWPGYDWSAEMIAYDAAETAALEAGDLDAAVQLDLDMWLRGPARSWDEVGEGLAEQLRGPLRTLLANQEVVGEHSQGPGTGDLTTVSVPTLMALGKLDVPDFQDIARRYAAEIPGAELVEFTNAAHLIAMDAPGEVGAVLGEFLGR